MEATLIRPLRRSVGLVWLALLLGLVGLVGINMLGPHVGYQIFIIRGASMDPALPLGALVGVQRADPKTLTVGDVVSVRGANDVVLTHRIEVVDTSASELRFKLRGDANASADAAFVSASSVIGRVSVSAPVLGFLTALLSMPLGLLSLLSILASLLLSYWTLEDVELELAPDPALEPEGQPAPAADLVPAS